MKAKAPLPTLSLLSDPIFLRLVNVSRMMSRSFFQGSVLSYRPVIEILTDSQGSEDLDNLNGPVYLRSSIRTWADVEHLHTKA